MKLIFGNNVSVLLMSLVLLANAQRTSNNVHRDVGVQELARQNKITKQILEAFLQKKLGLAKNDIKPPSIHEILPVKRQSEERPTRQLENETDQLEEDAEQDLGEDDNFRDSLQSVESEQIDSIYSEG